MHDTLSALKWILIVLFILAWLGLCLANLGVSTQLVLFPERFEYQSVPVAAVLLLSMASTFVLFFVVGLLDQLDLFFQGRQLKKRIRELEEELDQLRNLPIRESMVTQKAVEEENRT